MSNKSNALPYVKFYGGQNIPLELHKVRVVQKLNLVPIERRLEASKEAGFNKFQLMTHDIFLDMLTDSGTNAMSDNQIASMSIADDAYAGSQSFVRMQTAIKDVLGKNLVLPAHQGRACENIISEVFVKKGDTVITNYHFTTTLAHILMRGGHIEELVGDEAQVIKSTQPFKGNMDIDKMIRCIEKVGADKISFVRMEALTNLIGGQPFSVANLREVRQVCDKYKIMLVLDASLIGENAYFVKKREPEFKRTSCATIIKTMCEMADIVYFSARKLSSARGGGICTNNLDLYNKMKDLVPVYEGFLTYGGMSVREIEAIAVGLRETLDETMISQSPSFIEYAVAELDKAGIPVVMPAGGLGCHVDAMQFVDHIDRYQYRAGALAIALYLISGVRGMERGTVSMERAEDGTELLADFELLRLAFPRRVFTLSQTMFVIDRLKWLYENRRLVGGLKFLEEPKTLRFFNGRLAPVSDWPEKLMAKFREDFGESL